MTITVPCTCSDEEHEAEVSIWKGCYEGPSTGDDWPCGRAVSEADIEYIQRALVERGD